MELDKEKLVSVIVLSHNSRATISRALHSIFVQDYSRIEVVISDDGSEDFSQQYVEGLVASSKGGNIERVTIVANDRNQGTVSNLWKALDAIRGDYFLVIGADDTLACKTSIADYMNTFACRFWKPLLVTGLAEVWSEDMNVLDRTIPEGSGRVALQREDPDLLLNALAYECTIPIAATCFHRSFVDKVNAFDCSYRYCEDHPTFIRMASKGIAPAYLGKVMVKCVAGETTNENSPKEAADLYADRQRMWKMELGPHRRHLTEESRGRNRERRQWEKQVCRKSKRAKKSVFKSAYDIADSLKELFTTKAVHRSMQSFRFTILLLLLCVAFGCVGAFGGALFAVFAFFGTVLAFCFLWFIGFGGFRLMKRALAWRRGQ